MMNDKEILEYSAELITYKDDVQTGQKTEPDIDEQVRTKFSEDSVNRSKFIDSSLVIGAVSKEYRNVFGIDVPHYEISEECHLAIDRNDDGKFSSNEYIEIKDDALRTGNNPYDFMDCWELINAARFDSVVTAPNYADDEVGLPVKKQRFFVDSKKDQEGSTYHHPVCPPGFDKWAGEKVYNYICKNYDLNEITLYKILSNIEGNTIPSTFTIDKKFNGDDPFECNINEFGVVTRNLYEYTFDKDSEENLQKAYSSGEFRMPLEGCKYSDAAPIKWYTIKVPVSSVKMSGKYYYTYDYSGTLFQSSTTPMVQFQLKETGKSSPFNEGIAILCLDPRNDFPMEGTKYRSGSVELRYCVHIIWRKGQNLTAGASSDKDKKFLWWSWTKRINKNYRVTFNPISSIPAEAKVKIAAFIKNMENDCLRRYELIKLRDINLTIPGSTLSKKLITNLRDKAAACSNSLRAVLHWEPLILALFKRVVYDILEIEVSAYDSSSIYKKGDCVYRDQTQTIEVPNPDYVEPQPEERRPRPHHGNNYNYVDESEEEEIVNDEPEPQPRTITKSITYREVFKCNTNNTTGTWDNSKWDSLNLFVLNPTPSTTTKIQYDGKVKYISDWKGFATQAWPRFLMKLIFKTVWEPVYSYYPKITITSSEATRSFNTVYERSYSAGKASYVAPSDGDVSKKWGGMKTLSQVLNNILTAEDKASLKNQGVLAQDESWIKINGVPVSTSSSQRYDVIYENVVEEGPTYTNIKRAQTLNIFMTSNPDLFKNSFNTIGDRIDKRTGTLRKTCSIIESASINSQMIRAKAKNIERLSKFLNAYTISGGFGTYEATINLATWEPYTSAYATLERMGTVYIVGDNTELKTQKITFAGQEVKISHFSKNYVRTTIADIIDLVSDTEYDYTLTEDTEIQQGKEYYIIDSQTGKYRKADSTDLKLIEEKTPDAVNQVLYEQGEATSGPIFKVKLKHKIPNLFKGKNPRLVKVY